MTIAVGEKLPSSTFTLMSSDGPIQKSTDELFAGKKVVLFGVPGAFTPTCNLNHLPGYVTHADAIKAKGVDDIAVVSVNDVFVMNQWSETSGGDAGIHFLADGSGEFTKAVGLDMDMSAFGMGTRSMRYSMIVDDGTVSVLNIEDSPKNAVASGAETIIEAL
ncbi:MAG: peroxiredoxin [Rhizobiaceae bacterium]|nr:peroxiredoxin [Rhizobiaceae bacterium]